MSSTLELEDPGRQTEERSAKLEERQEAEREAQAEEDGAMFDGVEKHDGDKKDSDATVATIGALKSADGSAGARITVAVPRLDDLIVKALADNYDSTRCRVLLFVVVCRVCSHCCCYCDQPILRLITFRPSIWTMLLR